MGSERSADLLGPRHLLPLRVGIQRRDLLRGRCQIGHGRPSTGERPSIRQRDHGPGWAPHGVSPLRRFAGWSRARPRRVTRRAGPPPRCPTVHHRAVHLLVRLRIRTGIKQGDTANTVEVNLACWRWRATGSRQPTSRRCEVRLASRPSAPTRRPTSSIGSSRPSLEARAAAPSRPHVGRQVVRIAVKRSAPD